MRKIKPRVGLVAPVMPNWKREVEVEHAFLTEIRTSRSGREQRDAVRTTARVSLNFNIAVAEDRAQRVLQDILRNQTDPWVVPVAWRQATLGAAAAAASSSLVLVGSAPFWAVPGARVVVQGATEEAAVIEAVTEGTLTLSAPLTADHPAGAKVKFAYSARFPDSLRFRAETPGVFTAAVRMEADPARDPQPIPGLPDGTYAGLELFLRKPNWSERMDLTFSREREVADFTFGRISAASPINFSTVDRRMAVYGFDAESLESVLGLFLRMKGRRGSFWTPTWTRDARPRAEVPAGALYYEIDDLDFDATYSSSRTHNRVIAFFPDGSYQINTITGIAPVSGRSRVWFASAWTKPLGPDSRIHWLLRSRFASDSLTLAWMTATVGRAQFSLLSLPTDEAIP